MIGQFEKYWRERGLTPFSPIQKEVFSRPDLLDSHKNLVIIAPTSSGKSLIIEYFISYILSKGKKAIYLSPFKSILEEKLRDFTFLSNFLNKDIIYSTHDVYQRDGDVLKGNYDLLLTVYEKIGYFLNKKRGLLKDVEIIIFDELSILEDDKRGPYIDILISRIKREGVRILGVTSYISSSERLKKYLDADLIVSDERPTPIRVGYLREGIFYWKEGRERLLDEIGLPEEEFFSLLKRFWEDEGALVFFSTRTKARRSFSYMVERLPVLYKDIEIKNLPETLFSENIKRYISRGIGYHSRDLTYEERKFIEKLVYEGKIKLLFATTTVALGVNLPFRNVVFPEKPNVSQGIFKNMLGRAARGKTYSYGRAIFFTEKETSNENGTPRFLVKFRDRFEKYTFLLRALVFSIDRSKLYLPYEPNEEIGEDYLFLEKEGLLKKEKGGWNPTLLGIFIASSGLDLLSFLEIKKILLGPSEDTFERFIYRFMKVHALSEFYLGSIFKREIFNWWNEIFRNFPDFSIGSFTLKEVDYIKKTLIILNLIHKEKLIDIEKRYKVSAGIVVEFFDRFSWIIDIANSMVDYLPISYDTVEALQKLESIISKNRERDFILKIDEERPDEVIFYGKKVQLTYKQFELLRLLSERPGKLFLYSEIMDFLWKDTYDVSVKQISYHKSEISKKLGLQIIKSIKGRGLYLDLLPHEVLYVKR